MNKTLSTTLKAQLPINAKLLWQVLTQSTYTKEYMFNCSVKSTWIEGASITWQGEYQGYKAFQKGEVITISPNKKIKYSTFDPNFGLADEANNYIHVTYLIKERRDGTSLTIINDTFDGNEERMQHVIQGWEMVIEQMKKVTKELHQK
jgi:uncharacterized protein YndB with AHSA1/START domain